MGGVVVEFGCSGLGFGGLAIEVEVWVESLMMHPM